MNESRKKIKKVQKFLEEFDMEAVRLKGVDWFSWITGGGSSVVIMTAEAGIAEVLVTRDRAWILTDEIERQRLAEEEIPGDFELVSFPWQDSGAVQEFIRSELKSNRLACDKPSENEKPLPRAFYSLRYVLEEEEIQRYRLIGEAAAEAMTEAITKAEPDWTEHRLAGEGAKSLWSRGLEPTLVLVGGENRVARFRHPTATEAPLQGYAMMVFCARSAGLYANLTRFVFFREPHDSEYELFQKVAQIENQAFRASRPQTSISAVYEELKSAYEQVGYPEEIHSHHQGGLTGYLSREIVARPRSKMKGIDVPLESGMALAWNPSLPGVKIEDTVLVTDQSIEVLTFDPLWPSYEFKNLKRPQVWVKS